MKIMAKNATSLLIITTDRSVCLYLNQDTHFLLNAANSLGSRMFSCGSQLLCLKQNGQEQSNLAVTDKEAQKG